MTIAQDSTIKNNIGDALYRRIVRASINKENFRVYIVIPLLPGFSNVNAVQAVLYFIMRSINKGETSLYQRLIQSGSFLSKFFIRKCSIFPQIKRRNQARRLFDSLWIKKLGYSHGKISEFH